MKALLRKLGSVDVRGQHCSVLPETPTVELPGWHSIEAARRQHKAFKTLLKNAQSGRIRIDFATAVRSIELTRLQNPLVLEVGCGTAYYSEVFSTLYRNPLRYVGLDSSAEMIDLAHDTYPEVPVAVADARALPFPASSCDVVFNGGALMHIVGTSDVVAESVRVTQSWCIFHTVPTMSDRPTTWLRKSAYGVEVVEVIFNRQEIESLFEGAGLTIDHVLDNIPYDVSAVVGVPTTTLTYVCRKNC